MTGTPARKMLSAFMERLWSDAERAYHARLLEALPTGPELTLLDVGCDDGEWTEELRQRIGTAENRVVGLEIVEKRAELARSRGFDIRRSDLDEPWPVDHSSIDIVHANQVIEHVKRLDHFVTEIRRVLVPGGLAVICTENLASWHNLGALVLGYQPFSSTNISNERPIGNPFALHAGEPNERGEPWQHIHVVTLIALRDIFAAHGFSVEGSWGTGYHPLPGRLGARLARLDPRHAHFIGVSVRAPS